MGPTEMAHFLKLNPEFAMVQPATSDPVVVNHRPIYEIAREIRNDWKNVNYAAKPYLQAMQSLSNVNDNYGADDAESIIMYFLGNAGSWRGDTAKRIKTELKKMIK